MIKENSTEMIAAGIPGARKNRPMDVQDRPMALADRLMAVRLMVPADHLTALADHLTVPADHLMAPADHLTVPNLINVSFSIQTIICFSFLTRIQIYRILSAVFLNLRQTTVLPAVYPCI